MEKLNDQSEIVSIFIKGMSNHFYFNPEISLKKRLIYAIWVIIYFFTCRKKGDNLDKAVIMYGGIHEKVLFNEKKENKIYHGQSLKSISQLLNKNNFLTKVTNLERVNILINSLKLFIRNRIKPSYFFNWLDFCSIYHFIRCNNNLKCIIIAGHYDRYATWISLLAELYKKDIIISQHGALAEVKLPHKIFCTKFLSFNDIEQKLLREFVVKNNNCIFENKQFESYVRFETYNNEKDEVLIGIASQDLCTNETKDLISSIFKINTDKKIRILLYPHPREDLKVFFDLQTKHSSLEIFQNERHKNISILVTFYSSIVYDYLYQGLDPTIICLPPDNIKMGFFELEKVNVLNDFSKINQFL